MAGQLIKYFYIDCEGGGETFLRNAEYLTLSPHVQKHTKVHVFYKKDTAGNIALLEKEWITKHPTTTNGPDASWVGLVSNLTAEKRFLTRPNVILYLVSRDEKRFTELISILRANSNSAVIPINSDVTPFTDCFDHVCLLCRVIFRDLSEKEAHDRLMHLLLCDNIHCERSKKGNGFLKKVELDEHIARQRKCEICTSGVGAGLRFCSLAKRDEHMRSFHIRRLNGSTSALDGRYDDQTVLHFRYSSYLLPCFAEPTCPQRFRTSAEQVLHHVTWHGLEFPYVCMACVKRYSRPVCLGTKSELIEHAKLMEHRREEVVFK